MICPALDGGMPGVGPVPSCRASLVWIQLSPLPGALSPPGPQKQPWLPPVWKSHGPKPVFDLLFLLTLGRALAGLSITHQAAVHRKGDAVGALPSPLKMQASRRTGSCP